MTIIFHFLCISGANKQVVNEEFEFMIMLHNLCPMLKRYYDLSYIVLSRKFYLESSNCEP